jgi:hypothetical protein
MVCGVLVLEVLYLCCVIVRLVSTNFYGLVEEISREEVTLGVRLLSNIFDSF